MSFINPLRKVTVHNDASNPIPVDIGAVGSIDVNVTNTELDTNITNTSIPVTSASTLDTNITNASIPITTATDLGVSINENNYFPNLMKGIVTNQEEYLLQGRGLNIGNTEQTLAPTPDTQSYQRITNTSGVPVSIVCDGADTTCRVMLTYYANSTATSYSTAVLTVNGTTPVAVTDNFYRVHDFQVYPFSSSQPDQSCYLYVTAEGQTGGVPDGDLLYYLYIPTGKSEVAMYYTPPGTHTVLQSAIFMSDQGNADRYKVTVHAYGYGNNYEINFYMGSGIQQVMQPFIELPSTWDMEITVQRVAGAGDQDISILANLIRTT